MSRTRQVVVAQIGAAHGVKGEVRLKPFTQVPADVAAYGPLTAPDGRVFEIEAIRPAAGTSPDMMVVRFRGIGDRTAAEALTNIELSIPQDRLPPTEADEFYHSDLIGLQAVTVGGDALGTIVDVPNYGAGDLLEIAPPSGATILVPFTEAAVPKVDVAGGRVIVDPPKGLVDDSEEEEGDL
jgi:16S rRNA processing protein RimM